MPRYGFPVMLLPLVICHYLQRSLSFRETPKNRVEILNSAHRPWRMSLATAGSSRDSAPGSRRRSDELFCLGLMDSAGLSSWSQRTDGTAESCRVSNKVVSCQPNRIG